MDRLWSTAVAAVVFGGIVATPAQAESTNTGPSAANLSPKVSVGTLISQFEKKSGATVIASDSLDTNRMVPEPPGLMNAPLSLIRNVAGAVGANWKKTWVVQPATANRPEIVASDIQRVIDVTGTVTFDVNNLTAADAIRTVAKADNADVRITGTLPTNRVTLRADNLSIAEAIQEVSEQTHTNWSVEYRLWPAPPKVATTLLSPQQKHLRAIDRYRQEQARLNAPISVHLEWPLTGPDPRVLAYLANMPNEMPTLQPTITTPTSPIVQTDPFGVYGSSGGPIILQNNPYGLNPYGNGTTVVTPNANGMVNAPTVMTAPPTTTTTTVTTTP